jgi:hypothetical protein
VTSIITYVHNSFHRFATMISTDFTIVARTGKLMTEVSRSLILFAVHAVIADDAL